MVAGSGEAGRQGDPCPGPAQILGEAEKGVRLALHAWLH